MLSRVYIRSYKKQRPKRKRAVKIIRCIILLSIALVFLLYFSFKPVINASLKYQGQNIVTKQLTTTVLEVLENQKIKYNDIFTVSKDNDGKITAITANSVYINRCVNELTYKLNSSFTEKDGGSFKVPIGTLSGNELLMGRGFGVAMRILPVGYAEAELVSEISSAGINQICHKVFIKIKANYTTVIPLYNSDFSLSEDFLLSEAVIMGDIPESYTNISGFEKEQIIAMDGILTKNSL